MVFPSATETWHSGESFFVIHQRPIISLSLKNGGDKGRPCRVLTPGSKIMKSLNQKGMNISVLYKDRRHAQKVRGELHQYLTASCCEDDKGYKTTLFCQTLLTV